MCIQEYSEQLKLSIVGPEPYDLLFTIVTREEGHEERRRKEREGRRKSHSLEACGNRNKNSGLE